MRRPFGVTVSALVFALLVLPEGIWAAVLLVWVFHGLNKDAMDWPTLAEAAWWLALAAASALASDGLLRMQPWARAFGGWIGAILLGMGVWLNLHAVIERPGVWLNLGLIVLGTWWLVYFNLPSVRWSFVEKAAERHL